MTEATTRNNITTSISGGIAHVRLDRPEKLNGLTLEMLAELVRTAKKLRRDRSLRAIIISGEGQSFTAGLDFGRVMKTPGEIVKSFIPNPILGTNRFQEGPWAWRRVPVPVIAAVQGHCFGGGVQIALAADFRITTADAQWSVLEGKWGLIPDMSGIASLKEVVGIDQAKKLAMTAEVISGTRAVELGLATETAEDPLAAAYELAETLATRSPDAVAAAKRLFNRRWQAGPRRVFMAERMEQAVILGLKNTARARDAAFKKVAATYGRRFLP